MDSINPSQRKSTFVAWLTRMTLIGRWGLMHCIRKENVSEHSHQVAVVAHILAVIRNVKFGGDLVPERAATLGLYHEISEVRTQDISSIIKYSTPAFTKQFKKLELLAEQDCLKTLPGELRPYFKGLVVQDEVDEKYKAVVKAADILCAYIKVNDELRFNNPEFHHVKDNLDPKLGNLIATQPEVKYFVDVFLDSCTASVDELQGLATING